MTLSTHMIVGTAVASLFPNNPALGFGAAFLSHFVLDTIPHWDYAIAMKNGSSDIKDMDIEFNKSFVKSFVKISSDVALGFIISLILIFTLHFSSWPALMAGCLGGMMPDFLQLVYMKFKHEPFLSLQKFHRWIQKDRGYKIKNPVFGVLTQIIVVFFVVWMIYLYVR